MKNADNKLGVSEENATGDRLRWTPGTLGLTTEVGRKMGLRVRVRNWEMS